MQRNKLSPFNFLAKLSSLIFILAINFCTVVNAQEFIPGRDYIELEETLSTQKEVREFYSFFCPHCFQQEKFMHQLADYLPQDITFFKNHVNGMSGQRVEIEDALTKALITAQLLKIDQVIISAIFKFIHIDMKHFSSIPDIKAVFIANGVKEADFDKTFNSFKVAVEAKKMLAHTTSLRQQGINGVPTLIINGKYKPEVINIKTTDEYKDLIIYLLNKDS